MIGRVQGLEVRVQENETNEDGGQRGTEEVIELSFDRWETRFR
jgi:hypothetical protein